MDDVDYLVGEFSRVHVGAVGVVGEVGDVEGANVGDQGEALEEVVLFTLATIFFYIRDIWIK